MKVIAVGMPALSIESAEQDPHSTCGRSAQPTPRGRSYPALSEEQIQTAFVSNGWIVKELVEREIILSISENRKIGKYVWYAELQSA